jgi:quercetin dioxygenase-like cupin family protein
MEPGAADFFHPVGGVRLYYSVTEPTEDAYLASETFEERLHSEEGWHTTDTTDLIMALTGELTLEVENGDSRVIRPGDVVIQNGVRHRWRLTGDKPAEGIVFFIGANRA